jgi:hypothetical protein
MSDVEANCPRRIPAKNLVCRIIQQICISMLSRLALHFTQEQEEQQENDELQEPTPTKHLSHR